MYTLIVVDMQAEFDAALAPEVIAACQREIKLAMHRGYAIIFLEFAGVGDTIPQLKSLVKTYNKAYFAQKSTNSGASIIRDIVRRHNLYHNFHVVGVNTSYCVYDTVKDLTFYQGKITIVADACNCSSHEFGLNKLKQLKIKIINR